MNFSFEHRASPVAARRLHWMPIMKVLVLNVGSTSIKFDLYEMDSEDRLDHGVIERVGDGGAASVEAALAAVVSRLGARLDGLAAVGHRVVHGGERLIRPVRIDDAVEALIEECAVFAPIHNPINLLGIRAARARLPGVPQIAVFDTAFHATLPEHAFVYGLPHALYLEQGVRRYGFHGPSHQYMAACAAEALGADPSRLRLVTCHLGGGASVAAIDGGASIDTSMGMTPLEGLLMGTRTGDLDPAIPLLLARRGYTLDELDDLFNRRSGLAGVSGIGPDFRDLTAAAERGDTRARLAIDIFVHRLRKYIGAYAAELGGADAIVFTGGIGEGSAQVRERVCANLGFMGVAIDAARNAAARPAETGGIADVSEHHARTRVLVVHTEEERMIAREVVRCLSGPTAAVRGALARPIPVGVSVRHVHLSRAACDALFGPGYELTRRRDVSQPGQYVTRETVDLIGPRGELRGVGIINPLRAETQVELARTDAIHLGVDPPLRQSGVLDGTPGLRLRGPRGELAIERGVIIAQRHVHMSPDDARRFGVADGDTIRVRAEGAREATFGDVVVRVSPSFALDLHLDTDEANGAGLDEASVVAF
ncbi:MAG TPA: acetate/propionate family kinase, partial [Kofleriaceae bacterium]|nr:acetate/propionate family kinase [Kofleriaceae bacterium]